MQNLTLILLQAAQAGQEAPKSNIWMNVIFWVLLIAVIYFFMIRPASKRNKEAQKFKESLKKGSKVITAGGVYGIANGVRIKIDKNSIVSFTEAEAQNNDTAEKK